MRSLLFFVLSFTSFSTTSLAVMSQIVCEEGKDLQDLNAILEVTAAKTSINPLFSFEWNEKAAYNKKAHEFTLSGTVEFHKTDSASDVFTQYFLSEKAVTSVTHSAAGVKTLNQKFNGSSEVKDLPQPGKVVPFCVTAEKCKSIFCRTGNMESNCKFTENRKNLTVMECSGVPNNNMKSHSTKITCMGGGNTTKCNFELKGQPGSRKYALGGAAEALYNFYGLAYRSSNNKFCEDEFEKTGASAAIDRFYKDMIDDNDKKSYSIK